MKYWTEIEDKFLRGNYCEMTNSEMGSALGRSKSSVVNRIHIIKLFRPPEVAERMKKSTQFKKGHIPWDKGMKGLKIPGSEKTWFPKGHTPGNTLYDGCITIRHGHKKRGAQPYKYIRISKMNWRFYHQVVWEAHHGSIPRGKILRFKNGDSLDVRIENLELVTRREQVRDNYNPEKASASMKKVWERGVHLESDEYIASLLFQRDRKLRAEAKKNPELIELKREQIKLERALKYEAQKKAG